MLLVPPRPSPRYACYALADVSAVSLSAFATVLTVCVLICSARRNAENAIPGLSCRVWNNALEEHDARLKVIAERFEAMRHVRGNEQKIASLEGNDFILAPERAVAR